jgi:hypothetical protein
MNIIGLGVSHHIDDFRVQQRFALHIQRDGAPQRGDLVDDPGINLPGHYASFSGHGVLDAVYAFQVTGIRGLNMDMLREEWGILGNIFYVFELIEITPDKAAKVVNGCLFHIKYPRIF